MAFENNFLEAGGIRVRYLAQGGSGPPLVLVHGLGASADIWKDNIGALAVSHRVYAPDLVGFGYTDKPDIRYSPFDFLAFLRNFINALGLGKVSMAGLSLGGGIALLYALEDPEGIDRLVLVDSAGLGREMTLPLRLGSIPLPFHWFKAPRPVLRGLMKRLVYNPDVITTGFTDLYYEMLSRPEARRTVFRVLGSLANLSGAKKEALVLTHDRINTIKAPTLIVWGKDDRILPLDHGIYAERQIPECRLQIFEQCGHMPNLEKPREFNEQVLKFLSE
jgi:4,5:9,10-diseco-3-hydroxy-5,9,17-trioxoandrosta-1(10),2-diene-4-oate hydrolase